MQEGHINPYWSPKKKQETVLPTPESWMESIRSGDRSALARAITLLENQQPAQRLLAEKLLQMAVPYAGKALRIGLTGIPGAGKSTLIEALGLSFLSLGKKIAVLAVDPSSQVSGGSILGDKTRMEELSRHPEVFIRPSPSEGVLGGVAKATREAIYLCEAAGYDLILVETVGVGQSEIAVKRMTDLFLLVAIPGAGDELQGIKRGIMEMVDMVVVNKAEGDRKPSASLAARQLKNALHLLPAHPYGLVPEVLLVSALEQTGIIELRDQLLAAEAQLQPHLPQLRHQQTLEWLKETLQHFWEQAMYQAPEMQDLWKKMNQEVARQTTTPFEAAHLLWQAFIALQKQPEIKI
jgi:LAO/AO transport system kinase